MLTVATRYLIDTHFVNEILAEASLTIICVRYLTHQCFDGNLDNDTTKLLQFSLSGCYIFQDYAVAKWQEHFIEMLAKATNARNKEQLSAFGSNNSTVNKELCDDTLLQLADALHLFTGKYEEDLASTREADISLGAWDDLKGNEDKEELYLDLCNVAAHIQHHHKGGYETRKKISFANLERAFRNIRLFLENPKSEPFSVRLTDTERHSLGNLYGQKRFKCPKIDCEKFFDGFGDSKSRKKHVDGHDRPFRCDMPECQKELAGFKSLHDLQKHQSRFHASTFVNQAETFEPLDSLSNQESTAKWACQYCSKRYTRGFHLRAHLRTHTNERPFSCNECGKSFTRDYDRKRHEKTVHTRN